MGGGAACATPALLVAVVGPVSRLRAFGQQLGERQGPRWVPPLRERPEDIPPLVEKFLTEATRGRKRPELADGLMMWLQLQPWNAASSDVSVFLGQGEGARTQETPPDADA